ncbi:MAG: YceI family protein, partial [Calditrichaeota bacterium]
RQDFGVSWSQTMDNGGLMVGNDVKIELNVEAAKE